MRFLLLSLVLCIFSLSAIAETYTSNVVTSEESARCLNCHYERQKKLVETWEKSSHARNDVGCYECHRAEPFDPSAKKGHFGFNVQLPVTPLRCAECHPREYTSFASSSHALAYETIRNAELASTSPVLFESSCALCHGNELKMFNGKPEPHKWPNHGIGRINTDGSRGNCAACHGHHDYSLEIARSAETCGRCHFGKTGPAYETWKSSKHGSNWNIERIRSDFNVTGLVPSEQNLMFPDCYVCHIAPTAKNSMDSTHNPGERLSWKLAALKSSFRENWGQNRLKMQAVCRNCHGNSQVDLFYRRYDAAVMQINRLAIAAAENAGNKKKIVEGIKAGAITAKIGAAMLGPLQIRDGLDQIDKFKD